MALSGKNIWLALATVIGAVTGYSLLSAPAREVLYDVGTLPEVCVAEGCVVTYVAKVGNTGTDRCGPVEIALRLPDDAEPLLDPKLRNAGKVAVPHLRRGSAHSPTLSVEDIAPSTWIEMTATVRYPPGHASAAPAEIISVAAEAPVHAGSPTVTRFVRILSTYFAS